MMGLSLALHIRVVLVLVEMIVIETLETWKMEIVVKIMMMITFGIRYWIRLGKVSPDLTRMGLALPNRGRKGRCKGWLVNDLGFRLID